MNRLFRVPKSTSIFRTCRPYTTEVEPIEEVTLKVVSSCVEGTVMTGLNVLSQQTDPVALADSEYPPWLFTLLEPKKTEFTDVEKLSREYIKYASKLRMKEIARKKKIKK